MNNKLALGSWVTVNAVLTDYHYQRAYAAGVRPPQSKMCLQAIYSNQNVPEK